MDESKNSNFSQISSHRSVNRQLRLEFSGEKNPPSEGSLPQRYSTLRQFNSVVENCEVWLRDRVQVDLEDGMECALHLLKKVDQHSGKVVLIGNGGSATLASHLAVDLWRNAGIRAQSFNESSFITCVANDHGYESVFSKPIYRFCDPEDVLVAVSSSGKSINILKAVEAAKDIRCHVMTFSAFGADNPLRDRGEVNFYLNTDSYGIAEVGHLLLGHALVDEWIQRNKLSLERQS